MQTLHTCTISRNQAVGTNGRMTMTPIASNVHCTFIPMSAKAAISNNYSVGFGWDVYFPDGTDVRSGDRLTRGGLTYLVDGSMPYAGFPAVSHVHITAQTERPNGQ